MTFITKCPYHDCQKYMLLEDHVRGATVKCLCCKKPVTLDPGSNSETFSSGKPANGGQAPPAAQQPASRPRAQTSARRPPVQTREQRPQGRAPDPRPTNRMPPSQAPAASAPKPQYSDVSCPNCKTALRVPPLYNAT